MERTILWVSSPSLEENEPNYGPFDTGKTTAADARLTLPPG
jgi:hypothetical protein